MIKAGLAVQDKMIVCRISASDIITESSGDMPVIQNATPENASDSSSISGLSGNEPF